MSNRVISVIPARGGSKGLAKKNLLLLGGKPLVAWAIEAARASSLVDRILVSTDDPEIAEASRRCGAEVPFLRPPDLATDSALTEDVLRHAIRWLEEREEDRYEILLYLQPTDPFRGKQIVRRVLQTLIDRPELDSVFAAKPEHKNYWIREEAGCRPLGRHDYTPRQQKSIVYREDTGIASATRMEVIRSGRRIGDRVEIIPHQGLGDDVDIHSEEDLWLANLLVESGRVSPNG